MGGDEPERPGELRLRPECSVTAVPRASVKVGAQPGDAPPGGGLPGEAPRFGSQSSWDEFTQWRWVTIRDQAHGFPFWAMARDRATG